MALVRVMRTERRVGRRVVEEVTERLGWVCKHAAKMGCASHCPARTRSLRAHVLRSAWKCPPCHCLHPSLREERVSDGLGRGSRSSQDCGRLLPSRLKAPCVAPCSRCLFKSPLCWWCCPPGSPKRKLHGAECTTWPSRHASCASLPKRTTTKENSTTRRMLANPVHRHQLSPSNSAILQCTSTRVGVETTCHGYPPHRVGLQQHGQPPSPSPPVRRL